MQIRQALPADAEQLLEIYAPIVRSSPISFELKPPTVAQFTARVDAAIQSYDWLVMEHAGTLCGYAYAGAHRAREAYRRSVETSAYVHPDFQGQGIGRQLYVALFAALRQRNYHNAFAGITLPNDPSIALHEAVGFEAIGVFREVGFKFDRWHDVGWWQRAVSAVNQ